MSGTKVEGTTQYDAIVSSYSKFYSNEPSRFDAAYPAAAFEEAQVLTAITTFPVGIKEKSVLDLACGTGYYSCRLLSWGAKSVTGVDISLGMVEEARTGANKQGISEDRLRYIVGDIASDIPLQISARLFDIVTGMWLLNYAADRNSMAKMWRCIGSNLKSGGWFIGLTIPPLLPSTTAAELNSMLSVNGEWAEYGVSGHVKRQVADGFEVHIALGGPETQKKNASFDNFYLRASVFEDSLKDSNMFQGLEWMPVVVPEQLKQAVPPGFWNHAVLYPHCRVCIAQRL